MKREYHKWFSPTLGREMELLVFGHAGTPLLVFPAATGRFWQYEEQQMIAAVADQYESGQMQAFCLDSLDGESWLNAAVHPSLRAVRHMQYEKYVLDEVLPFARQRSESPRVSLTGCDLGGYHTINFALKHPHLVDYAVSLGGLFDMARFLDGFYDDNCYFNCPLDYLPGLSDARFLSQYRNHTRFVMAVGEADAHMQESQRLSGIMNAKGIPHWLDVWGGGAGHDWHWWRQMTVKFFRH